MNSKDSIAQSYMPQINCYVWQRPYSMPCAIVKVCLCLSTKTICLVLETDHGFMSVIMITIINTSLWPWNNCDCWFEMVTNYSHANVQCFVEPIHPLQPTPCADSLHNSITWLSPFDTWMQTCWICFDTWLILSHTAARGHLTECTFRS